MSQAAIRVVDLTKEYRIGKLQNNFHTLRDSLAGAFTSPFRRALGLLRGDASAAAALDQRFIALDHISFDVQPGEVVGIIGRNGAGKSTLLKILSRIVEPSDGYAEINGRTSSLLEVGTGFHPELTGRENVFLSGAVLGMQRSEIRRRFDEIVDFSEIGTFIDTPVKHYSSGMFVRLAFAVAAHLEPEILIIDEVLSVGDIAFQNKCLEKINDISRGGRTILLVSHNMSTIQSLCQRCAFLLRGRIDFMGSPKEAIERYIRSASRSRPLHSSHIVDLTACARKPEYSHPLLRRLEVFSGGRPLEGGLPLGAPLTLRIAFRLEKPTADFHINVGFDNLLGQRIFTAHTAFEPDRVYEERSGAQVFVCDLPSVPFIPGEYVLKMSLVLGAKVTADAIDDAMRITVEESDFYGTGRPPWNGVVALNQRWRLLPNASNETTRQAEPKTAVSEP